MSARAWQWRRENRKCVRVRVGAGRYFDRLHIRDRERRAWVATFAKWPVGTRLITIRTLKTMARRRIP